MPIDYSFPQWLIQRHSPWEALVAGVQAGSAIAANNQRGRALGAQLQHQAFQESVMQQKFDADAQDLRTLQEWWPTFANAEGDALQRLEVPPLKNSQMWNRITLEVGKKKQQAAASQLASSMGSLDLSTPEGQAAYYDLASQAAKTGLPMTIEQIQAPVDRANTLKRLQTSAEETARHNRATEENALLRMGGETFEPQVKEIDGERIIQLGPNHWQYLGKPTETKELPKGIQLSIFKSQMAEAQTKLADLDKSDPEYAKWEAKLTEAARNRDAMLPGTKATAAPTTGGLPKPATKAEFDALPAGTRFIDPEGKERIKQ